jgi:Tol biopolymer transport system component
MKTTEDALTTPAAKSQDPNPIGKSGAMGGASGMAAMGRNSPMGMADMSMPPMPMMSQQIYVRPLDQQEARPIEGALGDAPFFSPDGKWLGFWHASTATLSKVALSGGAPVKICDARSGISGAVWGPDDTIVFAWFDLFRVPAAGGSPKLLLKVDEQKGERFYRHPSFLPGGKALLFTIGMVDTDSYNNARIGVVSLETGEKKIVLEGGTSARYSPSGHLIYARGGKLLAAPFDVKKLQVTGPPFPVVDGVFMSSNTGMAAFSISADGSLVYAAGAMESGERLPVWVDRKGAATPLPLPPRSYLHPRLSPDERQLANEVEGASHDIYTYDLSRGVMTKLSFDGSSHWRMWTPKGDQLTFRSWRTGTMTMWSMPGDRSGPPELLTNVGSMQSPESWSPDGKTLALTQMDDPQSGSDIYVLALDGDRKPRPLIRTRFSEGSPKFSPDGKWLAYASNESGRPEIYAMAYPGPGPKIQISTDGGTDPVWRRSGRELYYRNGDMMMMVSITTQPGLTVSKPSVLWKGHYLAGVGSSCGMAGPTSANYDVTANGERFIMIQDKSQDAMCKLLHVARNWSPELKRARSN